MTEHLSRCVRERTDGLMFEQHEVCLEPVLGGGEGPRRQEKERDLAGISCSFWPFIFNRMQL